MSVCRVFSRLYRDSRWSRVFSVCIGPPVGCHSIVIGWSLVAGCKFQVSGFPDNTGTPFGRSFKLRLASSLFNAVVNKCISAKKVHQYMSGAFCLLGLFTAIPSNRDRLFTGTGHSRCNSRNRDKFCGSLRVPLWLELDA